MLSDSKSLIATLLLVGATANGQDKKSLDGYLEWRRQNVWIVDGQRIVVDATTDFNGKDDAKSPDNTPLGYEIQVEGVRRADGAIEAIRIEARQNDEGGLDRELIKTSDEREEFFRFVRQMIQERGDRAVRLGTLVKSGPRHQRARRTVEKLLPGYIPASRVRVYVVDNPEWNVVALENYSIYVFGGLLDDTDDDELALVLGHEVAHISHEHTRRRLQKARAVANRAHRYDTTRDRTELQFSELDTHDRRAAGHAVVLSFTARVMRHYRWELEAQADRVGMRYAFEAGYDVSKAPRLWERVGTRSGGSSEAEGFLVGSSTRWSQRAQTLRHEIELNYEERSPH